MPIHTYQKSFRRSQVLFNYSNIGNQSFLNSQETLELIHDLYFDSYRLGVVRSDIEEVEPILRNADILSVDLSSVRLSDAPATYEGSPNGFYGEEMCQILRYAGLVEVFFHWGFTSMTIQRI